MDYMVLAYPVRDRCCMCKLVCSFVLVSFNLFVSDGGEKGCKLHGLRVDEKDFWRGAGPVSFDGF
jgi:hypothetical protein